MRTPAVSLPVLAALLGLCTSLAQADFPGLNPASTGFNHVLLSMADGEFDPFSANPDVPGCFAAVCDGNYFVTQIAQWTQEELAEREGDAREFFLSRFGLDVDNLVASGQALFSNTYADPRLNYRVRFMASEHVHELGWQKHDWALVLFLLEDTVLGGEFEGVIAPAGSLLAFGEYWIQKSRLDRRGEAPRLIELDEYLVVRYRAGSPIPPANASQRLVGACEVYESPWGTGIAQFVAGRFPAEPTGELYRANVRNAMTFDGGDGLGTYPGVFND